MKLRVQGEGVFEAKFAHGDANNWVYVSAQGEKLFRIAIPLLITKNKSINMALDAIINSLEQARPKRSKKK